MLTITSIAKLKTNAKYTFNQIKILQHILHSDIVKNASSSFSWQSNIVSLTVQTLTKSSQPEMMGEIDVTLWSLSITIDITGLFQIS